MQQGKDCISGIVDQVANQPPRYMFAGVAVEQTCVVDWKR
jgi:hypothetical protein